MVFGLISAGLGIAQSVMGVVGAAKGAKGGGGGEEKAGKAQKGNAAEKGGGKAKKQEGNPVDKFLQQLNNPNVRSVNDIKNVRDQILQKLQQKGLDPQKMDNAKKKLNQAILKKLGIGKPGPNGDMVVDMTPKNQQLLQMLGMRPDEVRGARAGPKAGPPMARPPAGAKPPPGRAPPPGARAPAMAR